MSDVPSTAGGQEPQSSTPQVGASTSGQAPDGNDKPSTKSSMTLEQALAALEETRREAANHRVSKKELEAKVKEFQDAQLSESERREKAHADLQGAHNDLTERYQRLLVHTAVLEQAPALGIDGKLAARLINWSDLKINDEGQVDGLDNALKALVAEFPQLAAQQPSSQQPAQQQRPQVPPSNPQRGNQSSVTGQSPRNISWSEAFKRQS